METIIKPEMITWARKRAGLTREELADRLHVSIEKVIAWECGNDAIPLGHAKKLAHYALLAFGWLFADNPPSDRLPIPDFRTINPEKSTPSTELLETIYDAQEKQDWYRDYVISENLQSCNYVNTIKMTDSIKAAAQKVADMLTISLDKRRDEFRNYEEFLIFLMEKVENAGVLVLRNGVVKNNNHRPLDTNEFRGFALCDTLAPLIFINGKDSKSAQIFTIIHEIVHILLGQSALVDANMVIQHGDKKIEFFCNQVAAEFLVPEKSFLLLWESTLESEVNLTRISNFFKVSRLVIINRAFNLKLLDYKTWNNLVKAEYARINRQKEIPNQGGDFFATAKFRVSPLLSRLVLAEVSVGKMLYRDAFRLLGVKNKNSLQKFGEALGMGI